MLDTWQGRTVFEAAGFFLDDRIGMSTVSLTIPTTTDYDGEVLDLYVSWISMDGQIGPNDTTSIAVACT